MHDRRHASSDSAVFVTVAEDRATRQTRLRRGIGTSAVSRAIATVAPLVTIPLALDHLGATAYGAWSAALALTGFAVFADLGLGAGLMTKLAAALSDQNYGYARELVSSAYVTLSVLVGALIASLWVSSVWVDYGALVGAPSGSREISTIVAITLTVFLIGMIVSLIVRVQYAAQQIAQSNIWQSAGSIAGVVATFVATLISVNPPLFIVIATAAPLLVASVNSIRFFLGAGSGYRPTLLAFRPKFATALLRVGSGFLAINILMAATTTTDNLIVSNTTSLELVPQYAIPARVFSVMAVATTVLAGPLWPMNVEAMKRGDIDWVRSTTRKMSALAGAAALLLGTVGVIFGPRSMSLWLDGKVNPSTALLIGLAGALLVQSVASPFFMVQNAALVLSPQIIGYALLVVTIPVKWVVSLEVGFEYIPYVSAVGFLIFVWPAVYIGYRRAINMQSQTGSVGC